MVTVFIPKIVGLTAKLFGTARNYDGVVIDDNLPTGEEFELEFDFGSYRNGRIIFVPDGIEISSIELQEKLGGWSDEWSSMGLGGVASPLSSLFDGDEIAEMGGTYDSYWIQFDESTFNVYSGVVTFLVEYTSQVILNSPISDLFCLSVEQARNLAGSPMYMPASPEAQTIENVSISSFILNLISIPFEIPVDSTGESLAVKLGQYVTGVEAPRITDSEIFYDLGTVKVAELLNNSLDYVACSYSLHLPFIPNIVKLLPDDAIAGVKVGYVLNPYDGGLTVNIHNSNDVLIETFSAGVGMVIPVRVLNDFVTNSGKNAGVVNEVRSISIKSDLDELANTPQQNLVKKSGSVGIEKGFFKFEYLDVKIVASLSEIERVNSMLKAGVIVK